MSLLKHILAILPPQASTVASEIDNAFWIIHGIAIGAFILVEGALIYFVWRFRRRKGEADRVTPYITHNTKAEIIWTVIPSLILIVVFYYGAVTFVKLRTMPADAQTLKVTGQKWAWTIDYPFCEANPKTGNNECIRAVFPAPAGDIPGLVKEMVVQKGEKVVLEMGSVDVIHSFYVPAFRVKQDVVPGLRTRLWFEASETGTYDVFCAEYCGDQHSGMIGRVKVLAAADYQTWKEGELQKLRDSFNRKMSPEEELIASGQKVFSAQCASCHKINGERLVGPPLNGIIGRKEKMKGGLQIVADEAYITESIKNPAAKIVESYPPAMPKLPVSDTDIQGIIAYLKTLK